MCISGYTSAPSSVRGAVPSFAAYATFSHSYTDFSLSYLAFSLSYLTL